MDDTIEVIEVGDGMTTRTAGTARRIAIAAVAAALTTVLAAGCEGDDKGGRDGKDDARKASAAPSPGTAAPSAPADSAPADPAPAESAPSSGRTLTKAELAKAALVTGDVPHFVVSPMQGGEETGTEQADKQECRPLAAMINGAPEPVAAATVFRTLVDASEEGKETQTVVTEILTSHANGSAAGVLRSLRTAVEACAGGFTTHGGEGPSTYAAVRRLPAPRAGDDAFAYQVTGAVGGAKVPLVFHVVRRGASVATFYAANFVDARTPEVPAALVTEQAAKLP
ncbi:hypothetical protein ACIQMR_25640 [Streptomyces sp. NPDC091376]|uniref:hypothetical protein n=1 Tax=Streptomyces sp. NPDC091376 TaxID=3365994 RepID=UPI0037F2A76C